MVKAPEEPTIEKLTDGVFVRQEIDNMGWADLGGFAVVIDALEHRTKEGEVLKALSDTLGDTPVKYVLNTHTHPDHTALNEVLVEHFDAALINMRTADLSEEGASFAGERRTVRMIPMPGAHTPTDCVYWFEEDRVLFVGDLFGWGLIPTGSLDKDSQGLILDYYRQMVDLGPDVVVPGHGPLADCSHLRRFLEYFEWMVNGAIQGFEAGKTPAEVLGELGPPRDMHGWWRFYDWKHDDARSKVIEAARNRRIMPVGTT